MASVVDARLGLWQDYSRRPLDRKYGLFHQEHATLKREGWQYLENDFWLRWMTAFVAVSLTLISPCVFKIGRSFLISALLYISWFESKWREARESRASHAPNFIGEQTPLLQAQALTDQASQQGHSSVDAGLDGDRQLSSGPSWGFGGLCGDREDSPKPLTQPQGCGLRPRTPTANSSASPIHILKQSESSRISVFRFIKEVEKPSTATIVITTVLFGLCVVQAIADAFSAKIASNRIGLSSSKNCGIWQFDDAAGEESAYRDDLNNHRKEARASEYARNCYNSPETVSTLSCKIFYNQSIAYSTQVDQRCPFSSSELCLGGLYSAVTFDTGVVDASVIGINAPSTHKFRRTTTCSPLNMSEPYVRQISYSGNDPSYEYFYGSKDGARYTFTTSGQPVEWLIPAYAVK